MWGIKSKKWCTVQEKSEERNIKVINIEFFPAEMLK